MHANPPQLRPELQGEPAELIGRCGEVRVYSGAGVADTASDQKEFAAHAATTARRSPNAGLELFDDIVFKSNFIKTFQSVMPFLAVEPGHAVLELGAGHGWASLLVKRQFGGLCVASDLVPESLAFCGHYERLMDIALDQKWAFNIRRMPFADGQFDRIFTFAAFHHFGDGGGFGAALAEMLRVLKPSGQICLLYEPSAPPWLYGRAFRRANRRTLLDGVDEDLIVPARLVRQAAALGATATVHYHPEPRFREGLKQHLYYTALAAARPLTRWTVSTVNVRITRK